MDHSRLFYVLNGLVNGERGVTAARAGGGAPGDEPLADGHYFFKLNDENADGHGPYANIQEAWDAALRSDRVQTWVFPLDGSPPHHDVDDEAESGEEANVAMIEEVFNGNQSEYFECTIEGSYETLTLRISCGSFENAAEVYATVLLASAKHQ